MKFYVISLLLYNDYNNHHLGGKYNNLDDASFLNNTTNINVLHDTIDVVVIEWHKNFPGSNSFLSE